MADTSYPIEKCGFFDSVNQDRLYSAEDMNQPYKRLVSNGVFATPAGDPSNDFRVVAASGLTVTVKAGQGIFGDKWFSMASDLAVNVPVNSGIENRLDSIIARVDTRQSVRAGAIVYRTGVAGHEPQPPALDTTTDVHEYRLANVLVAAGASEITQANITDTRMSDECGFVTSLVKTVDTSVLYDQWAAAYQEYYDENTGAFAAWVNQQKQAWSDLMDEVQSDLSAVNSLARVQAVEDTANIAMIGGAYRLTAPITSYIPTFNPNTDLLNIYINGIMLDANMWSYDGTSEYTPNVIFNFTPPSAGNKLVLEVLKSVVPSDVSSTLSELARVEQMLTNLMSDSGWITLTLDGGAAAYDAENTPRARKIGNMVYLCGAFTFAGAVGAQISGVAVSWAPEHDQRIVGAIIDATDPVVLGTVVLLIDTSGNITLENASTTIPFNAMITFDGCWSI